jgi:hypothetical protein
MANPDNNTVIEAGHSIEVEGKQKHYDQSAINDPNWIILEDVMRKLKVTTARAVQYHADSPAKKKWQKKYAKINGRDRVFYSKIDVDEFIASRGPMETFEAKTGESPAEDSPASPAKSDEVATPSDEEKNIPQENLPPALIRAGETSPEISKFVDFHMKIVTENKDLKTQAHSAEKNLVFWKTSLFWLIGVSLLTTVALGFFAFSYWGRVGELTKTRDDLFNKTISLQDEIIQTKSSLMAKDQEIQQLRQTVNAQVVQQ